VGQSWAAGGGAPLLQAELQPPRRRAVLVPGPWGTLLAGKGTAGPQICGAQRPAELRLAGTLVDDGDYDVVACVVGRTGDSCEAAMATARRRCASRRRRSWLA
jgi:hypothetical protein